MNIPPIKTVICNIKIFGEAVNNTHPRINFAIYAAAAFAAAVTIKYLSLVQRAVNEALFVCAHNIIPSLFVFSVLTVILISSPYSDNIFTKKLSKWLGFNGNCGTCVFFGLLAGFPTAAVVACDLLERGQISKRDCEKAVYFASNAGISFILGGIGGMFGDINFAKTLFFCQTLASITCLAFFREKRSTKGIGNVGIYVKQQIKFTEAVSRAALSMLRISAFVCFFTVIKTVALESFSVFCEDRTVHAVIISFLELGNAAKMCASLEKNGKLLCAFAVGFGGLSAMLQSFAACPELKMSKYFASRLLTGGLCTAYYAAICNGLNFL